MNILKTYLLSALCLSCIVFGLGIMFFTLDAGLNSACISTLQRRCHLYYATDYVREVIERKMK